MKIAIFDPAQHVVGLKLLFEEAHYYSINPHLFFKYQQRNQEDFYNVYNFNYLENLSELNDKKYDILIIVFVTYDGIFKKSEDAFGADIMLENIRTIIKGNNFKNIFYFDNYDYNYDPAPLLKINDKNITFFKRNYCYDVEYSKNTYSFPFMIFGQPKCILWTLLSTNEKYKYSKKEYNEIFFSGALYKHIDSVVGVIDREGIHNEIKRYLHTYSSLDNTTYLDIMSKYLMALDLNGLGNPNRRSFEILLTHTLLISQKNKLVWPFEEKFDENTIFENKDDFIEKLNNLISGNYLIAKEKQDNIFNKYFNKEWLRNYILNKITNNI
jgi:hypothetical protein